jgi:DNA transformation protein and related proteins
MTAKAAALIRKLDASLTPLGAFRSRPMFGGHGLYLDDVMFGLIAYDKLYLKTDDETRGDFENAKSESFAFESHRKGLVTTSYWQCPAAALKDARKLRQWVGKAHEAARRVKAAKPKRKPRKPKDFPF